MSERSWVQPPHCGDHFSCTIHLDQSMEAKIEWKLTRHCCKCCNPEKGKVDFEDSWVIKSSFITKDEMKACQLTRTKLPQKKKKRIKEFSDDQDKRTNKKHCIEATEQAKGALAFRFISEKKKKILEQILNCHAISVD